MSVILPLSIDVAHISGASEALAKDSDGASAIHAEAHALFTCLYDSSRPNRKKCRYGWPNDVSNTQPEWLFIDVAEWICHSGRGGFNFDSAGRFIAALNLNTYRLLFPHSHCGSVYTIRARYLSHSGWLPPKENYCSLQPLPWARWKRRLRKISLQSSSKRIGG